jgi:histidine ammonia-lyase
MHINEDAVSFAAFSLAKLLAAELLRKGILDREQLVAAIAGEIAEHRKIAAATNEDAAVLLEVYRDEMPPG